MNNNFEHHSHNVNRALDCLMKNVARYQGYARKYGFSVQEAEDMIADVAEKVIRNGITIKSENLMEAFLFRSFKHRLVDNHRKIQVRRKHLSQLKDASFNLEHEVLDKMEVERLLEVLERSSFSPTQKKAFKMLVRGYKPKEVAELLELSINTVRIWKFRIQKKLFTY